MGYWSDRSIEEMERPNLGEIDKFVCAECVIDDALAEFVQSHFESNRCDYCGATAEEPIAAPFNVVMSRIFEAISTKYADAQDVDLPWVEGGWLTEKICAMEVVEDFDPGWDGAFVEDVLACLDPMAYWTKHVHGDWAISNPQDTLRYGWEGFKTQVLTKTRYLFLTEPEDKYETGHPDYLPIARMLDALGQVLRRHSPSTVVDVGERLFRVRAAKPDETWSSFDEVGVPPIGVASAGRMNPAGIPYFYLGIDEATAVAEVITKNTKYFVATFETKRPLRLINLIDLPKRHSPFLPELYDESHEIGFLHDFARDLCQPVSKDGREHVEYVPTQIVSEFLRYRFRDAEEEPVDGLIYASVKNPGSRNFVIFESTNEHLQDFFLDFGHFWTPTAS
jgi:hypothetical protein